MYLDAIVVKVKDGAHVGNKAAHIAIGVVLETSNSSTEGTSDESDT